MSYMKGLLFAGTATLLLSGAASAAPADDTLVVGLSTDSSTFDPANITSRDNTNVAHHIFATLYAIKSDGSIQPYLANAYKISDDGLEYTFTLNQGWTCEDGEPLTAEDVAYSFTRAADPKNGFTGNTPGFVFTSIAFKGAEPVDDLNVKIKLGQKTSIGLGMLSEVFIHCKDSYEKLTTDQAASSPVASGSYKLVSWARGSEIVLEKIKDPGQFKKIVWRIIPEASTRSAELIAGNVDIITNVAPDQVEAIDASGAATVKKVQGTRRIYIGFNQSDKFSGTPGMDAIKKPEVRRAMQYAVDVPSICKQLLNFECKRASSLVNPPNDDPSLEPYPYDPAMAEKLLDEAGYPRNAEGVRFELKMQAPRGRYLNDANVALAVGQYLSDIGVKTEVEPLEWASVYIPIVRKREAGPLFMLGTGGSTWSAVYDMSDMAVVDSGTNYTQWKDPNWFDAWPELNAAKSPEEERAIINKMLKVFHDDGPWLFLYFQPDFYGISKRVAWEPRRDEHVELFDAKLAN